jgi:ubiquinone/menaquinone biosynthesis C-methylase UbiE
MYQKNKEESPNRIYIELPTFLALMTDIKDEDIIELACGTGFYTRIFREKTSGLVYGADISEDMINYAKK